MRFNNMKYSAIILTDRQDNPVRFYCPEKNQALLRGVFRPWIYHGRDAPFCVFHYRAHTMPAGSMLFVNLNRKGKKEI